MNKIEIAKKIIKNNGSCNGVNCDVDSCPLVDIDECSCETPEIKLMFSMKYVMENQIFCTALENEIVAEEGCSCCYSEDNTHNPLDTQVGGSHYKNFEIQPVTFTLRNNLNFLQGCIVKRICRYNLDGAKGIQDLKKIKHECDILIAELCEQQVNAEREEEQSSCAEQNT